MAAPSAGEDRRFVLNTLSGRPILLVGFALVMALCESGAQPLAAESVKAGPAGGAPPRVLTDPASLVSAAAPDAKPTPIADLYFLRSSSFGLWTPDGKSIVIATDLTGRTNLWKVPLEGGFPVQLQQSQDATLYPVITPDGRQVIYASDRAGGEIFDLFGVPADGGEAVNLTDSPDAANHSPLVSPDSRSVAFDRRIATESSTNIALLALADRTTRQLTHERGEGVNWHAVAFSRDGRRLIANRANASFTHTTIWSIDPVSGVATRIPGTPDNGYAIATDISPDGRLLALTTEDSSGRQQAAILDVTTSRRTLLDPGPWEQQSGRFAPDGSALLAIRNVNGRQEVFTFDVRNHSVDVLPLPVGHNSGFWHDFSMPAFSPDGSKILYPHSAGSTPLDYWIYDRALRSSRPVTRLGLASVYSAVLPPSTVVSYRSRNDLVISALLWMPYNLKRDSSAPAVVIAHGGPTSQTLDSFDQTAVALASRGYVVIAPNVRGSTGYGRAFQEANHDDLGGGDLEDEANAARFLVRSGYVDAKKVGITGGSFGGFMTVMALATMPDFWAAGVERYGVVNWNSMWEHSSPLIREFQRGLIGDPVTNKEVYARVSPLTYLGQTKAPLLVLQGENDIRVPKVEAEQIVAVLKAAGGTVEVHYYPEEGHEFHKRETQIDALERTVSWFDRYLKGVPTSSAQRLSLDESSLPPPTRFLPTDLDESRSACDDFTDYVNGKWKRINSIPADRTSWGSPEILEERSVAVRHQIAERVAADARATGVEKIIGDLWVSGMDEAGIETQGINPLRDRLAAINVLHDKSAIAEYLRRSAARGDNLLFGFAGAPDFENSAINIAYATQGGLGLPDKSYYFAKDKQDKLLAYRLHVARTLELSGVAASNAAAQAKAVVALETRLAGVSKSNEELSRDVALAYHPLTPAEADQLTPNFSWSRFFASQGLAVPEKFSLAIPAFHAEVSKALADTPPSTWRAYLRFHTLDDAAPYLNSRFVDESFDFYGKTLRGQAEQKPRWKRVLSSVDEAAGEAFGQLYVKVAFSPDDKAKVAKLVENLRAALRVRIQNVAWMSDATRMKALAKWETLRPKIGYPDKWRDWSGLATGRASYFGNIEAAREFNYQYGLAGIGKPVDRTVWSMTPQTVNAYYDPQKNEIVFSAAVLQPPFFDPRADDSRNYGGIGALIGHELTHGYDDQGARFGANGNLENWWMPQDKARFEALTVKLVDQFNRYEIAGQHVNGKLTLGENIADLGGLATAFDAMERAAEGTPDPKTDGLSREQLFFFNFSTIWRRNFTPEELKVRLVTDSHAPADFRASGAPSNMPEFSAAFHCKPGDAMVLEGAQRVVIW
jgi:putative endopeptidase